MNSALPPRFVLESAEKVSRGLDSQLFNNERSRESFTHIVVRHVNGLCIVLNSLNPYKRALNSTNMSFITFFNEIETFKPKIVFNILITQISLFKTGVWWGGSVVRVHQNIMSKANKGQIRGGSASYQCLTKLCVLYATTTIHNTVFNKCSIGKDINAGDKLFVLYRVVQSWC